MAERQQVLIAVHLIIEKAGKILLLRRYNTGYEDGNYSMVAGHVETHERALQAMAREAEEEAGLKIQENHMEIIHVMHRKSNQLRIDFFIRAMHWKGEPTNREPEKCDELSWFEIDKLPKNIIPYVRHAMENIRQKKYYSEFGWE